MNFLETNRKIEPGWAIKLPLGWWLCYAHGWEHSKDPFYAKRFSSEKEAEEAVKESGYTDAQVLVAWEPYCAKLLFEIEELKKLNTITPEIAMELMLGMEHVVGILKNGGIL